MTELVEIVAAKDDAPLRSAALHNAATKWGIRDFAAESIAPRTQKMAEPAGGGRGSRAGTQGATRRKRKSRGLRELAKRMPCIKRAIRRWQAPARTTSIGAPRCADFETERWAPAAVHAWETLLSRSVGEQLNAEQSCRAPAMGDIGVENLTILRHRETRTDA